MNVVDVFDERASVLLNMHYGEATQRLAKFLDWLESEPTTLTIVTGLRQLIDVTSLSSTDQRQPPSAGSTEEIAAVGLALIEDCRRMKFFHACQARGIEPPYNTSALQDYGTDAVPRYVDPFVSYVRRKLVLEASKYSIAGLGEGAIGELFSRQHSNGTFRQHTQHLRERR